MIEEFRILICGVGGQGVLTLSRVVAVALHKHGCNVVVGETLGMAQRGGSVHSYVKASKSSILSPVMSVKEANVVIGLELTEVGRALPLIGKNAHVFLNDAIVHPVTVVQGVEPPTDKEALLRALEKTTKEIHLVDASKRCIKLVGTAKYLNTFMLGLFVSKFSDVLGKDKFLEALEEVLPKEKLGKNVEIFNFSFNLFRTLSLEGR